MTALIALASHDSEQTPLIVRDNPDPNSNRGLRAQLAQAHAWTPNNSAQSWVMPKTEPPENEDETNRVIPVYCSNLLNERNFGELQGMHSRVQRRTYPAEALETWRCSWDDKFPGEKGESSKDVSKRVIEFFQRHIEGTLQAGGNVMIVAHGFVQRVLIKYLLDMSDEDWVTHMKLESHADVEVRKTSRLLAKNGVPVVFSYSPGVANPVVRVDTLVTKMSELFAEEEEGMYHQSGSKL